MEIFRSGPGWAPGPQLRAGAVRGVVKGVVAVAAAALLALASGDAVAVPISGSSGVAAAAVPGVANRWGDPLGLNVVAGSQPGSATVTWTARLSNAMFGRDGTGADGAGQWTSPVGATSPAQLGNLRAGATYTVTVQGQHDGRNVAELVQYTVPSAPNPPNPSSGNPSGLAWKSGAALHGVYGQDNATGLYATWRGRPLDIGGAWADQGGDQRGIYMLREGGHYEHWNAPIDVATGALLPQNTQTGQVDETWAMAKNPGAVQDRWREGLTYVNAWASANSNRMAYVRFAHEMNGDWYHWQVNRSNYLDFIDAWRDYYAIMKQVCPTKCKLVFNVNRESVFSADPMNWKDMFPGKNYVDVLSVDYYDQNPAATDAATFWDNVLEQDSYGAPKGIESHRQFAESQGLPFAVPEWSGIAGSGDNPDYVEGMYNYFRTHAGTGPGKLLYEIQFNYQQADWNDWLFYAQPNSGFSTNMPRAAARYCQMYRGPAAGCSSQ